MRSVKCAFICVVLTVCGFNLQAQDSLSMQFSGYVKHLSGIVYSRPLTFIEPYLVDNLLHNRLNFEALYGDNWSFRASARNRVFWGDLVKLSPEFDDEIEEGNNDSWDLSVHLAKGEGLLVNAYLDRLHFEYRHDNIEVTVGRQRINWGIHTFWNPHDLFNTYNFVDFDYEERPGSDAINVTMYQGYTGQADLAVRYFEHWDEAILAGRYKFNIGTYDIQAIGGYYRQDWAMGLGWAGNLGNASLKGETAYFVSDTSDQSSFVASIGSEYVFANGLFLGGGFLFNEAGSTSGNLNSIFEFDLSPRNIYPYKWSAYVSGQFGVGPLASAGMSLIYSPVEVHPIFAVATISYGVGNNWDVDLTTQLAFDDTDETYQLQSLVSYIRLKWSF